MKKLRIFLLLISFAALSIAAQPLRKVKNEAFRHGEKLEFRVFYDAALTGKVTAGSATLELMKDPGTFNSRPVYHVKGVGLSRGAFNFFFKVEDRFESIFDAEALVPYKFVRRTREGGYKKDDDVRFFHDSKTASSRNARTRVPADVQDILSAFYYARTLDYSNAKKGDLFPIPFFLDDSVYTSAIQFEGREVVKTSLGKFRCLKFRPMVVTGDVFDDPYPMTLYVTDDKNRIPILGESAVVVGKVKMELVSFENLANPLTAKIN